MDELTWARLQAVVDTFAIKTNQQKQSFRKLFSDTCEYYYEKIVENKKPSAPTIKFTSPSNSAIFYIGSSITISADGTYCDHIAAKISGSIEYWTPIQYGNNFSAKFKPEVAGDYTLTVYGRNTPNETDLGSKQISDSVTIKVLNLFVLANGSKGDDVAVLQAFLQVKPVNGFYDEKTTKAVSKFQQEYNKKHPNDLITNNGETDRRTWGALGFTCFDNGQVERNSNEYKIYLNQAKKMGYKNVTTEVIPNSGDNLVNKNKYIPVTSIIFVNSSENSLIKFKHGHSSIIFLNSEGMGTIYSHDPQEGQ